MRVQWMLEEDYEGPMAVKIVKGPVQLMTKGV